MARTPRKPTKMTKTKAHQPAPKSAARTEGALPRRQILKGVVAGSGVVATAMSLPTEWSKPVVQSIFASAQAQVSPPLSPPPPLSPSSPSSPLNPLSPSSPFNPPLF